MQEELSSSDRPGKPEKQEEQHVRNHDRSGQPDGEERLHKVQEGCHLKNRDDTDKFNLAIDDETIDFNISGIPDATVKRSQSINIHDLIQRIESQPQKEAIQNDLEQHQSFNPFSDKSKVAIMAAGNTEICEIINVEPKWQCKACLKHCSTGIIYCTCGQLMTDDSAENRKYISVVLDTSSIPNFYIRKHRPHGHRYGKALGCKDYFTENQLAKKCRKKKYESIHDRFIRDKTFRKAMTEVGRSETIIKEISLQVKITLTKPIKKRLHGATRSLVVRYLFADRVSTCREFRIFIVNKSVTADVSLLSPTRGVNGIHPAPKIHEHFMIHKGYGTLRKSSRTTSTTLSAL